MPNTLLAKPKTSFNDLRELIAAVRASLEKLSYASAGMSFYPATIRAQKRVRAAHLSAAWAGRLLERCLAYGLANLARDVVNEPVHVEGFALRVLCAPGLGVETNEERVARLHVDL
ncbi:MAG: tripartite tricarboxylate transporter substrate-binding protein [Pseudomonadota bacterium]|nr:tripartite tricarboxylate transporter substrate-binding protein [Pseudomonadota bacterium]